MKIELETIPVWDGVKSESECYICDLMKEASSHAVSYYLGSAIMVPEIRVEMNKKGFCPEHFKALKEGKKAQALGLFIDTFFEESKRLYTPTFDRIEKGNNLRKLKKAVMELKELFLSREEGCLICDQMKARLERYLWTTISLYRDDPAFKSALLESKGFCVHHSLKLLDLSDQVLKGDDLLSFIKDISGLLKSNLERIQAEDYYLTQKYKSENKDKPWNGCEDAAYRAVDKLIGQGRVIKET